jgi:hypothetical protein
MVLHIRVVAASGSSREAFYRDNPGQSCPIGPNGTKPKKDRYHEHEEAEVGSPR